MNTAARAGTSRPGLPEPYPQPLPQPSDLRGPVEAGNPPPDPSTERPTVTTDPRIRQLAETMHGLARRKATTLPEWSDLPLSFRNKAVTEARLWLAAAVEAGIAPPAVRPTDDHEAVYVDEQGFLYGEYRASPKTEQVYLLRLQWVDDMAVAKSDLEQQGAALRLLGWSA